MKDRPTVAVVIPCFNDGATLDEAVRSTQGQSRIDELVVVDDGSTDLQTLAILDALREQGARVIRQDNRGPGPARMAGVQASSADYVLALDADDRLLPGALAVLAAELDRDQELALAWGDYAVFGEHSYRQRTAERLDPWQVTYQNDMPASAMIRRSVLAEVGGWEAIDGYEDWDLWMKLAEHSAAGRRVPIVVYEYRRHGVRRLGHAALRHHESYALLRARHPALFASRRATRRHSSAPLTLRLALPLIFVLPIGENRRRVLGGAACHLAHRRGLRLLLYRSRHG